jgi:hypothetical protein
MKLTTKARNALPASTFAGPGRSYPIPDASHAANAKARAKQQFNKGQSVAKRLSAHRGEGQYAPRQGAGLKSIKGIQTWRVAANA